MEITYSSKKKKSFPPPPPYSTYIPKVVAGGRALHVAFEGGSSIQDRIAINGYTLIVTSTKATQVTVDLIADAFQQVGMPLTVVNVVGELDRILPGKRNVLAATLWKRAGAVVCRPDLYVGWTLFPNYDGVVFDSTAANLIASTLCGLATAASEQSASNTRWLTWRMVRTFCHSFVVLLPFPPSHFSHRFCLRLRTCFHCVIYFTRACLCAMRNGRNSPLKRPRWLLSQMRTGTKTFTRSKVIRTMASR